MCQKPLNADRDQIRKQGILRIWTSLSSERTKVRQSSVQKTKNYIEFSKENSLSKMTTTFCSKNLLVFYFTNKSLV